MPGLNPPFGFLLPFSTREYRPSQSINPRNQLSVTRYQLFLCVLQKSFQSATAPDSYKPTPPCPHNFLPQIFEQPFFSILAVMGLKGSAKALWQSLCKLSRIGAGDGTLESLFLLSR